MDTCKIHEFFVELYQQVDSQSIHDEQRLWLPGEAAINSGLSCPRRRFRLPAGPTSPIRTEERAIEELYVTAAPVGHRLSEKNKMHTSL